jgi:SAM-dependent methyltransferase
MNARVIMHPCQLDPDDYRERYPDLRAMTDAELLNHFHAYGKHEGRIGARFALRENFAELLSGCYDALEIGPDLMPTVAGPGVKYFDLLDREGIRRRCRERGNVKFPEPPHIDFVSPTGDLSIVSGVYDAVVSSHCVEHQPDLLQHLKDVERLLKPGGVYALWIPDKRYCFDHFIAESTLADVLQAHAERRTAHVLASIVEHRALITHNDTGRHWAGDHEDPDYRFGVAERAQAAIREFVEAGGAYIDVHAWQFTPDSFFLLIDQLAQMGMSPLKIDKVFCTTRDKNEFAAVLARA